MERYSKSFGLFLLQEFEILYQWCQNIAKIGFFEIDVIFIDAEITEQLIDNFESYRELHIHLPKWTWQTAEIVMKKNWFLCERFHFLNFLEKRRSLE